MEKNILKFKDSEKGVSLIMAFFVMIIILSIIFSVSIILYSEIKVIRNIGDSVVAFYVADSGVEKTLYYDRKVLPKDMRGSKRGICNICNSCPDCDSCEVDPNAEDCNIETCENCTIIYESKLSNGKTYSVKAVVTQSASELDDSVTFSNLKIFSTGSYLHSLLADPIKRAVQLESQKDESDEATPQITDYKVSRISLPAGEALLISANINTHGHGVKSAKAFINFYPKGAYLDTYIVDLETLGKKYSDGMYSYTYITSNNPLYVPAYYIVEIEACDMINELCNTATINNDKPFDY